MYHTHVNSAKQEMMGLAGGVDNLLGHVYKVLGYFFLFKTVSVSSIEEPFARERQSTTNTST